MTDLLQILPSFPVSAFAALMPTIEQHALTTTDLLALHPTDLAKQTQLPIIDLRRLLAAIQASLSDDLVSKRTIIPNTGPPSSAPVSSTDQQSSSRWGAQEDSFISTLDDGLDTALGGGVPVGRITEFVGESGAGKTQFLLSLCLAVQLPPPRGLGKQALYISTESGLATRRLAQMLDSNPILKEAEEAGTPASLDDILSTVTPDLESQDHILEYQVPVMLAGDRVGLLVLDSVAANYRAEFERQGSMGHNMAARSAELIRLGALLRNFARKHHLAVVVANQVADRFSSAHPSSFLSRAATSSRTIPNNVPLPESPLASRSLPPPPPASTMPSSISSSMPFAPTNQDESASSPALALDHQQRWFTGWGDDPETTQSLKTPSLGLVWSTQIACRVALFKRPRYGQPRRTGPPIQADDYDAVDSNAPTLKAWRRWMKVVFAPHVEASGQGLQGATEYQITAAGLKAVGAVERT